MDLSLSLDQQAVSDLVAKHFHDGVSLARESQPYGISPSAWKRAVSLGIHSMGLPESLNGGGGGLDLLIAVAEELGRRIVPIPFIENAVASRLLAQLAPHHPLLAEVASGDECLSIGFEPARTTVVPLVPAGSFAGHVLLTHEGTIVLTQDTVAHNPRPNFADMALADRSLVDCAVIGSDPAAWQHALSEWRTLVSAYLVGIARASLELAVTYVKTRHQFGRPVGAFQAVAHGLADLPGLIDGARFLTHEAAWALDGNHISVNGADGHELAIMAFHFCSETSALCTQRCIQYHGGYGYAEEQDPQLFYRRARGWSLATGPLSRHLDELATLTFTK